MASSVLSPGILYAWLIQRKKQRLARVLAVDFSRASHDKLGVGRDSRNHLIRRGLGLAGSDKSKTAWASPTAAARRRESCRRRLGRPPDRGASPRAVFPRLSGVIEPGRSMRRETSSHAPRGNAAFARCATQVPSQSRPNVAPPRESVGDEDPTSPPMRRGDRTFPPLRRGGRGRGGESNGACKPLENPSNPNLWCF